MRERINRLAKGIVDWETPEVVIRPEQIRETILAGELANRELYIVDMEGRYIKGLIYSSNLRVRVKNSAFGGVRNRVSYEVDTAYLTQDDVIEGAFYLVTNGGEEKVPYSFVVELGVSGKTLESLKTPADYGRIAEKDAETALRLFEYQDFVEAPFMQDLHIRTLYDGLRGGANRQNLLEEFLVAMKVKPEVSLSCDTAVREFSHVHQLQKEELVIRKNTWGYIQFTVSADGDFLELPKKSFTGQDFKDGSCRVPYQINPAHLHGGKNLGVIRIRTVREQFDVPVEAQGGEEADSRSGLAREDMGRYLSLRLDYEIGLYEERLLINQMKQEAERLRRQYGESGRTFLIQAELALAEGNREAAGRFLESCQQEISGQRAEQPELYCFYQYLSMLLQEKDGQRRGLIRLVKKYVLEEQGHPYLYLLWLKLEPEKKDNPGELLGEMSRLFSQGCCSPFLYAAAWKLYRENPALLTRMGSFELQVMNFAVRRELMDGALAEQVAGLAGVTRQYHKMYAKLLIKLYEQYPRKPFLSAVCGMLIKGDCRQERYFSWYQKALEEGVSLTRLYEYYLYALPKNYPYLLPREVLMYFSYENSMDDYSRSVLYCNIIKYMNPDSALYKQYVRDMEKFTMDQLLKSRINQRLVVLYQHMIFKEMIDAKAARVLPSILKSCRISVKNPQIRYVIVCYEELKEEDAYPVQDGTAYVPIFLDRAVLLFQDGYGNRYANISYRKIPAMDKMDVRELEETCYEIYPSHPMLRLAECDEILEAGVSNGGDEMVLKRANADLPLHPLYRKRILARLIAYHQSRLEQEETAAQDVEYLLNLDLEQLDQEERIGVCETLIQQEYTREAYDMVCRYGWEHIRSTRLLKLCANMILKQLFDEDEVLLKLSCRLFSEGKYDSVVLDYLCEYFNGSGKQMFRILNQAVREHVDVHDMPERLLAQMVFTGDTDRIDQVFDWYAAGKKVSDNLVKAYFTLKSADYFLRERPTDERVFAYLEGAVQAAPDKTRIPTIYLLALARYYATLASMDGERQGLCQLIVDLLLAEGRIFAWMKDLGRFVELPESVRNQVIVEYHGGRSAQPELEVRILPDEEEYRPACLKKAYPGIFVWQQVLFEGELLEYQIYEEQDGVRTLKKEGGLSCDPNQSSPVRSRYAALNEMGLCLSLKEEGKLKEKMIKYLTDSAVLEEMFTLM